MLVMRIVGGECGPSGCTRTPLLAPIRHATPLCPLAHTLPLPKGYDPAMPPPKGGMPPLTSLRPSYTFCILVPALSPCTHKTKQTCKHSSQPRRFSNALVRWILADSTSNVLSVCKSTTLRVASALTQKKTSSVLRLDGAIIQRRRCGEDTNTSFAYMRCTFAWSVMRVGYKTIVSLASSS